MNALASLVSVTDCLAASMAATDLPPVLRPSIYEGPLAPLPSAPEIVYYPPREGC